MKQTDVLHITRDKVIGFAVALALHSFGLYGLWRYQIIPPHPEALTVFASIIINPPVAAQHIEPKAAKPLQPAPVKQETLKPVEPVTPKHSVSSTPVSSPNRPFAPPVSPASTVTAAPASAQVSPSSASRSVSAPPPIASVTQPVFLSNELSVSCTDRTPPTYPKQSLRLKEQGKTVLLVELDEFGHVAKTDIKTSSGFPRLDEAAITAVKTWRCSPATHNGVAVRSSTVQPFNFTLKGR